MLEKDYTAVPDEILREVKETLEQFQEGYRKRDINHIDCFMDKLFAAGNDVIVMGTSDGELCLDHEQANEVLYPRKISFSRCQV